MKKPVFTGSGVAIVTPFNQSGIDWTKLAELIEFQIKNSTDAIIICGTTGESSTMTDEEHVEAIRFAVKQVAGHVPVVAGAGSNDTSYALTLIQESEKAGANAILLVTPYYNKTTQAGLVKHFTYLADRTKLPIILYNVPARTGMTIAPETYYELSKHDNINAAKEACGNLSEIAKTAALCGGDLLLYSGNDDNIVPIMSLGGIGVISVLANVLPRETHDICQFYLDGKVKESCELQLKLLEFMNNLFIEVSPIPVKTAMNLMGFNVGSPRMPLDIEMSDKNLAILKESMKKIGLI